MEALRNYGLVPLSRHNWTLLLGYWKYFPFVTPIQLLTDWYPMGKTSYSSFFNFPGRPAWITMELFAPCTLLFTVFTNPTPGPMPLLNKYLTALFVLHYSHRALASPLRNPSMGETHILITLAGVAFNIVNGSAIGAWLGGYSGKLDVPVWQVALGSVMFFAGLAGNLYHEEILRDLRRMPKDDGPDEEKVVSEDGSRVYRIPQGGLFRLVWFPHYFVEWIEWAGFMLIGGGPTKFLPAALFVINEIATMLPRALAGKRWYEKKFGKKAPERMAAIPGVI